ncbi:unnamed protein product, partial [Prorocentrum cordatum]
MQGRVATRADGDHMKTMTTEQILAYWRIPETDVEMTIRRLNWYVGWARDPQKHSQELCLLFGSLEVMGCRGGHLHGDVPGTEASPWLRRCQKDFLRAAEDLDSGRDVCEFVSQNPGRLLDQNVVTELPQLDFTEIRARCLSHAVPPFHTQTVHAGPAEPPPDEAPSEWQCDWQLDTETGKKTCGPSSASCVSIMLLTQGIYVVISVAIFLEKCGHLFIPISNRSTEMELEKPDWLQDVKGKLQAGKGDHEIIGQLVLIIARLVLADSRAIAELTATVYTTYALDYVESGVTDLMEDAGKRYQEISNDLAEKKKTGEVVDFKSRGPPHLHIFMIALIFLAKQETEWGRALREIYEKYIKGFKMLEVGEVVLHWQWKRNRKEGSSQENKGRFIIAIDSDHEV